MANWNNTFTAQPVAAANPSYEALTLSSNIALVWPVESLQGVPYVAAAIDVTATAGGFSIAMPSALNGSTGVATLMTNIGSASFAVTDSLGNAIITIAAGVSYLISLTDNTTAAGKWRTYQLAATTSNANAAALAGAGLQANGTQLQTNDVNAILNANTLITTAYRAKIITWTGAAGDLTLDTLANLGAGFSCWIINQGTGSLTIMTSGTDTINNGAPSIALSAPVGASCSGVRVSAAAGQFNITGSLPIPVSPVNGGTGISNNALSTVAVSGNFPTIFTVSGPTNITLPTSGTLATTGANSFSGKQTAPQLGTTGNLSSAAWTTAGLRLTLAGATLTDTSSSGTVPVVYGDLFGTVTFAANSSETISDAYGAFFKAPVAGTNVTLTRVYAIGGDSMNLGGGTVSIGYKNQIRTPDGAVLSALAIQDGNPQNGNGLIGFFDAGGVNRGSIAWNGTTGISLNMGAAGQITASGSVAAQANLFVTGTLLVAGATAQFSGITTTGSSANAFLDPANSNNLLRSTSSVRYKTGITYFDATGDARSGPIIDALKPILYTSLAGADDPKTEHYGFLAEDVAKVVPEIAGWLPSSLIAQTARVPDGYPSMAAYVAANQDAAGRVPENVQYDRFVPIIIAEIKSLRGRLKAAGL